MMVGPLRCSHTHRCCSAHTVVFHGVLGLWIASLWRQKTLYQQPYWPTYSSWRKRTEMVFLAWQIQQPFQAPKWNTNSSGMKDGVWLQTTPIQLYKTFDCKKKHLSHLVETQLNSLYGFGCLNGDGLVMFAGSPHILVIRNKVQQGFLNIFLSVTSVLFWQSGRFARISSVSTIFYRRLLTGRNTGSYT